MNLYRSAVDGAAGMFGIEMRIDWEYAMLTARKPYPSDLSDEEWQRVKQLIRHSRRGGRQRSVSEREVLNAILYLQCARCTWRMLPHDLPYWGTVYYHYCRWQENGTLFRIQQKLRR